MDPNNSSPSQPQSLPPQPALDPIQPTPTLSPAPTLPPTDLQSFSAQSSAPQPMNLPIADPVSSLSPAPEPSTQSDNLSVPSPLMDSQPAMSPEPAPPAGSVQTPPMGMNDTSSVPNDMSNPLSALTAQASMISGGVPANSAGISWPSAPVVPLTESALPPAPPPPSETPNPLDVSPTSSMPGQPATPESPPPATPPDQNALVSGVTGIVAPPAGAPSWVPGGSVPEASSAIPTFTAPASSPAAPMQMPPDSSVTNLSGLSATPPANIEAVPTDLSGLIQQPDVAAPNNAFGSSAVDAVPQTSESGGVNVITAAAPVTQMADGGGNGGSKFPKLLIAVGGVILLAVIAGTAYFILGIGQPSATTSAPIETPTNNAPVLSKPPQVIPSPASKSGTPSGGFGSLPGGQATASATPSGTKAPTSAIDLLKQQQQR